MNAFWKAAIGICGLSAVAFFVFFSLYKDWLHLNIFSQMDKHQTFIIMLCFLFLTFAALVFGLVMSKLHSTNSNKSTSYSLKELFDVWNGANEIDPDNLIGPDITKAANCLSFTATIWHSNSDKATRSAIYTNFGESFRSLYVTLKGCNKVIPGYEKTNKLCKDSISQDVDKAYASMMTWK